jgi:hypothetical protein
MSFYHHVLENYILSWLKFSPYLGKSLYLSLDALWMLFTCRLEGRLALSLDAHFLGDLMECS